MANRTPEVDQTVTSRPRPLFGFNPLSAELQTLRQEAIADIVVVQPSEKQPGLQRYDSPKPCMDTYNILEPQVRPLIMPVAAVTYAVVPDKSG